MGTLMRTPGADSASGTASTVIGPLWFAARAALWLLAAALVLALGGAGYEAVMAAGDAERYPPPGRLVAIGDSHLHLHCVGEGAPAVILISGLGGSSLLWEQVQTASAPLGQVCAYDRAGIGWSDASSELPTPAAVATELRALLTRATSPGPTCSSARRSAGSTPGCTPSSFPRRLPAWFWSTRATSLLTPR